MTEPESAVLEESRLHRDESKHHKLLQRRKDRRITRIQRRTVRERLAQAKKNDTDLTEQVKKMNQDCIEERRKVFESYSGEKKSNSTKLEHPAVSGYVLKSVEKNWDPRILHPMFFGYNFQRKAEDTIVLLDIKIFGVTLANWDADMESALLHAVHDQVVDHGVPEAAVFIVAKEAVRGENLRRVTEKVTRRAENSATFRKHLELLTREKNGGALNVKVGVVSSGTKELFEDSQMYVYRNRESDPSKLDPNQTFMFDIKANEEKRAKFLSSVLMRAVSGGTLCSRFADRFYFEGGVSIAINFVPRLSTRGEARNYSVPNDTPRKRHTKARELSFHVGKELESRLFGGCNVDHEAEKRVMHSRPHFEKAAILHPAHFNREIRHERWDPRLVSPIFASRWNEPLIPAQTMRNSLETHPAYFTESDWAAESFLLHKPVESQPTQNACSISPVFFGRHRCEPDGNSLLSRPVEKTLEEEAQDDEKFVESIRKRKSAKKKKSAVELEKEELARAEEERRLLTIQQNIHPAVTQYKVRERPLFDDAAERLNPVVLGYETSQELLLPKRHVVDILHPACVGYQLVVQDLNKVQRAAEMVHPIFFGLTLERGRRYEPPVAKNLKLEERTSAMLELMNNPRKNNKNLCHICFDADPEACPNCWRPEKWMVDGIKDGFEKAGKNIVDKLLAKNPNVLGRRGRTGKATAAPRTTMKLKLRNIAAGALKSDKRLASPADIAAFRSQVAKFIEVYVKTLPSGGVVKLKLEPKRTISDLYFLFRANAPSISANMSRMWIVLPLMEGLVCLDETVKLGDDLSHEYRPGHLTLADFGFRENGQVACFFHVKDLYHPKVSDIVRTYLSQNVNLARKLDEEVLNDSGEPVQGYMKRKMQRYQQQILGTGMSIRTRISEMRKKVHKDSMFLEDELEEQEQEATSSDQAPDLPTALDGRELLDSVQFSLLFKPDQIKRFHATREDTLQSILAIEMNELSKREEVRWQEEIALREKLFEDHRQAELDRAIAQRFLESPSNKYKKKLAEERNERRARLNAQVKAKRQLLPPLETIPSIPILKLPEKLQS